MACGNLLIMQVHRDIQNLPEFRNAVLTIGTFDGVHKGHQLVIGQLKWVAEELEGESIILTFHPHPRRVIGNQDAQIRMLNTLDEKIDLLANTGIDHLVVIPFTEQFAMLSPVEYIQQILIANFKPKAIVIGYDHHFGRNREGNYALLEALQNGYGYKLYEIPEKFINNITISSTKIRSCILNGQIAAANDFLGYPYFFEGTIIHGNKLGRSIGYPTANIQVEDRDKLLPSYGVYAVMSQLIGDQKNERGELKGMLNFGVRPTVQGGKESIEVHLFDFDEEIYGQGIRIYLHHRLRGEQKFPGLDALKDQLKKDEELSRMLLEVRTTI